MGLRYILKADVYCVCSVTHSKVLANLEVEAGAVHVKVKHLINGCIISIKNIAILYKTILYA